MDEDGNFVEGPGQGVLYVENVYMRGYVNLPEMTKNVFIGDLFCTGDICRRDENGDYYVVGRSDDMFKINGNRIEPAEIEAAVKRCTGLNQAVAKGFNENGRSYICVYYLKKDAMDLGIFDKGALTTDLSSLKEILPQYMIPAYYVPLEAFPINENGKMVRKDLKAPEIVVAQVDYVAPKNETEKYLCEKMAQVLKREKISAIDDFFLVGGDSLASILLIEACDKLDLNTKDIYTYGTPQQLAKHYEINNPSHEEDEIGEIPQGEFDLTLNQKQHLCYQRAII